jgi:hypothetical protein
MEYGDRPWVVCRLEEAFGDVTVVRKGVLIDASALPGFVATPHPLTPFLLSTQTPLVSPADEI